MSPIWGCVRARRHVRDASHRTISSILPSSSHTRPSPAAPRASTTVNRSTLAFDAPPGASGGFLPFRFLSRALDGGAVGSSPAARWRERRRSDRGERRPWDGEPSGASQRSNTRVCSARGVCGEGRRGGVSGGAARACARRPVSETCPGVYHGLVQQLLAEGNSVDSEDAVVDQDVRMGGARRAGEQLQRRRHADAVK